MIVEEGYNSLKYIDLLPIIFIAIGAIAVILAICVILLNSKRINKKGKLINIFAGVAIALFVGVLVTGIIGIKIPYYTLSGGEELEEAHSNEITWVCLAIALLALFSAGFAFLIYAITKKDTTPKEIVDEPKSEDPEILFYEKHSLGAIEVRKDYVVFYRNWLPFTFFTFGRISMIIFINDIQHVKYKGCGWFAGGLMFTFKHFNRPARMYFWKWLYFRRRRFNQKLTPVYNYLRSRIIENNK